MMNAIFLKNCFDILLNTPYHMSFLRNDWCMFYILLSTHISFLWNDWCMLYIFLVYPYFVPMERLVYAMHFYDWFMPYIFLSTHISFLWNVFYSTIHSCMPLALSTGNCTSNFKAVVFTASKVTLLYLSFAIS